uniref:hypothetical protein n=1 Tax=Lactobacillus acidophilus TaxID=1579 RepID=UPI003F545A48
MAKKQIEDKSLTVSEIAEKADVSRSLVWSYIRKNKLKPIRKNGNTFKFDSKIVLEIKKKQEKKQENKSKKDENKVVSNDVLEILHEQLNVKDEQIRRQAETIEFLRSEVVQARLENKQTQKLLESEQQKNEAISASDLKQKEKKQSWWQRLFNM